ncbi:VOC family protein [Leptolyngbya sp. FACHB-261]|uniref:VOC family protein n=1 Tax=Leptolyngbya sp. FACHB-261 TaxID=2692806 RepID=UPI001689675D|nr:VOC family protein [Leptolyngbya sp. FACHB-261]MBD2104970.1 VOC family protein [Leptolyngbya sp. FACHB-261]
MKPFTQNHPFFKSVAASAILSSSLLVLFQATQSAKARTFENSASPPHSTISQHAEAAAKNGLDSLQIFNVAISVSDIDASVKWYEDNLGFQLQNRRRVSTGIEIALIENNGFFIDLIHIAGSENLEGSPKEPPDHLKVQGLRNLVFWVDDLKSADAQLKSKGVELIWESRYIPEVGTSVTNFRDNNGNLIAIWERN